MNAERPAASSRRGGRSWPRPAPTAPIRRRREALGESVPDLLAAALRASCGAVATSPEDAQDLTQGFFARVLERHDFRAADPARGRFRSFLLTALKHYVINEHERDDHREARADGSSGCRSTSRRWNARTCSRPRTRTRPDRVFDRKWAAITPGPRAAAPAATNATQAGKGALADALLPYLTETATCRRTARSRNSWASPRAP